MGPLGPNGPWALMGPLGPYVLFIVLSGQPLLGSPQYIKVFGFLDPLLGRTPYIKTFLVFGPFRRAQQSIYIIYHHIICYVVLRHLILHVNMIHEHDFSWSKRRLMLYAVQMKV